VQPIASPVGQLSTHADIFVAMSAQQTCEPVHGVEGQLPEPPLLPPSAVPPLELPLDPPLEPLLEPLEPPELLADASCPLPEPEGPLLPPQPGHARTQTSSVAGTRERDLRGDIGRLLRARRAYPNPDDTGAHPAGIIGA
jgi:hypothetical protein